MKFNPNNKLLQENKNGEVITCEGFIIEVFSDESEKLEIDVFSAAIDFELVECTTDEVERFAKDYIDCEEKEHIMMVEKFDKTVKQ